MICQRRGYVRNDPYMKAILFDLDGVLYEGDRPIEGAAECIDWCQRQGIPHLFITNTTSRPRSMLVAKLERMGIRTDSSAIFSPPVAARQWLEKQVTGPTALFVPEATRMEFEGLVLLPENADSGAAAVVLGDLGERWNFALLNRAFRLLMATHQPPLVALGMTRYWRAAEGLRLDVGPFVAALEYATGTPPVVLGKPAASFFLTALERLGAAPEETLMIGDDIRSDIDAAQQVGIRGGLVRTGKFLPSDLEGDITPFAVLESVAGLPGWWQSHHD